MQKSFNLSPKKYSLTLLFIFSITVLFSQNIGINSTGATPNNSAMLDIDVSALVAKKGILIPRITVAEKTAMNPLTSAAQGLMIYQTDGIEGFYYNTSTSTTPNWVYLLPSSGANGGWGLNGNAGTVYGTNFIGTTDNVPLVFRVNNSQSGFISSDYKTTYYGYRAGQNSIGFNAQQNTAFGYEALCNPNVSVSEASNNVAFGYRSLYNNFDGNDNIAIGSKALLTNISSSSNVAIGTEALYTNEGGSGNIGIGFRSLFSNTIGHSNNATGNNSLFSNTTGYMNVAIGSEALYSNTIGGQNTAIGANALRSNIDAWYNTAVGERALYSNITGYRNTANGRTSLYRNTTGDNNTAHGASSLLNNTTGRCNTSIGSEALYNNTTGNYCTGVGWQALYNTNASKNTALGDSAGVSNTTGSLNTYVGYFANGTSTITNATAIGANASVTTSNSIVLGNNTNVGIGTTAPSEKLDVIGKTKTSTLQVTIGATTGNVLTSDASGNATWQAINSGTVTSIALSMPSIFSVSGSPITTSGTLAASLATQSANTILAGPTSGAATAPTFRSLVASDIPTGATGYIQNNTVGANFATGQAASFDIIGNGEINGTLNINGNVGIGIIAPTSPLHVYKVNDINKSVINSYASQLSATADYQNRAITGIAKGGDPNWGYAIGVVGMGDQANSYFATGVYAALGTTAPSSLGGDQAIYADGANLGYAGIFMNGNVGIGCGAPAYKLHVIGDIASSGTIRGVNAYVTGAITACSDVRYKKDFTPIKKSLDIVLKMEGFNYYWNQKQFPDKNFNDQKQIGFKAQDLQKLLPEVVFTDTDGYLSVDYSRLTPVLVEAIKEQQKTIEEDKKKITEMETMMDMLNKRLSALENANTLTDEVKK